jgi:hypothetical protein
VIVDQLHSLEGPSGVERRARVCWDGGERDLCVEVPAAFASEPDDASPFLACVLPLAMRCGEDLRIDGRVSAKLIRACAEIQEAYSSWDPGLAPVAVEAAHLVEQLGGGRESVGFFSRGVDSLYTALADRDEPLTALLFVDGLEPVHDAEVRRGEVALAREAAEQIGLPLITARTNMRELIDELVIDWEDHVGAGLSCIALSLAGGLRSAVLPSSDTYRTLEPAGTSPLLDPLFSTERVSIRHDSIAPSRPAKLAWLAEHHPEVLRFLKVCFNERGTGNCGHCGKCLVTMVGLHAAGALHLAEQFPSQIDHDAITAMNLRFRKSQVDWIDAADALVDRDEPLREAILQTLERSRERFGASLRGGLVTPARNLRAHYANSMLVTAGGPRATLPQSAAPAPELAGLIRTLDGDRHVYRLAAPGPGQFVGELGSLLVEAGDVPVWISAEGRVATSKAPPPGRMRPGTRSVLRWVLAPLAWRDGGVRRLTAVPRRAALLRRRPDPEERPSGPPSGYLHAREGEGRLPLWLAVHPITGDQLLTTWHYDALDMGYEEPTLLGHLEARAPVTGRVSTSQPQILWASRFGQRVRMS